MFLSQNRIIRHQGQYIKQPTHYDIVITGSSAAEVINTLAEAAQAKIMSLKYNKIEQCCAAHIVHSCQQH